LLDLGVGTCVTEQRYHPTKTELAAIAAATIIAPPLWWEFLLQKLSGL
jgi:hypothetical protein